MKKNLYNNPSSRNYFDEIKKKTYNYFSQFPCKKIIFQNTSN